MDTNSKTGNSTRSASTSVQRLTSSGLRERLFQEQEARIAELVRHNAELSVALEHERKQSRRHASAHQIAQAMLITAGQKTPETNPSPVPSAVHPAVIFSGWGMAAPALVLSVVSGWSLFQTPYHSFRHLASEVLFWQTLLYIVCLLISCSSMLKPMKEGNTDGIRTISWRTQMAVGFLGIGSMMTSMFRNPHLIRADCYALVFVILLNVSFIAFHGKFWNWMIRRVAPKTAIPTQNGSAAPSR